MLRPKPQERATNQPTDTDAGTQPWRADTGMGKAGSLRQQRACAWWIFQTSRRHEIPEHTHKGTPDQAIGCPYLESQRRHQREKASSTRMQLNFECPVVARLRNRKDPRRSYPSLIAYSAQTLALPQDAASRVKWWGEQSWRSGYLWRYRTKLALTLRPEDGSPRLSSSAVSSATVSASASALVVIGMTCEVAGRLGVRVGGRGRERGEVGMLLLGRDAAVAPKFGRTTGSIISVLFWPTSKQEENSKLEALFSSRQNTKEKANQSQPSILFLLYLVPPT